MRPLFLDRAFGQPKAEMCHADRGETVRNQYSHASQRELREAQKSLIFGSGVEACGGLVEDEDLGVPHICPSQSDLLPLTRREVDAMLEPTSQHLTAAHRKRRDESPRPAPARPPLNPATVPSI